MLEGESQFADDSFDANVQDDFLPSPSHVVYQSKNLMTTFMSGLIGDNDGLFKVVGTLKGNLAPYKIAHLANSFPVF